MQSDRKTPLITYTPDSALRRPAAFVSGMLASLRASLRIGLRLAKRDLDAHYRQSLLGYLWVVLPVLVTATIWIGLARAAVLRVDTGAMPYWVFVLTGSVFWQAFMDALSAPPGQFQANRLLLARVNFPIEALLISGFVQALVSLVLRVVVVAAVCMLAGVAVSPTTALMILPLAGLLLVGMVAGTLLVPFTALFGDASKVVVVLSAPLMLIAPVAYPPQAVQGFIRNAMDANPLTPLILAARDLMLSHGTAYATSVVTVSLWALLALVVGWTLYRLVVPILIEKLEA
jgi:lipopolysaccharide transport system permease protein